MKSENVLYVRYGSTDLRRTFILVVDDDKLIADTLALILESKGTFRRLRTMQPQHWKSAVRVLHTS